MVRMLVVLACLLSVGACAGPRAEAEAANVQVVPLEHASAVEIAATLNELLEASRHWVWARGCALPLRGKEDEVYGDRREPSRPECRVEADPRTNSVVISAADPIDFPRLLELISRLDQDPIARY